MKKKRSKLISMLLTLVMTLSLVPAMGVTASAAESEWKIVNTYDELEAALSNQNPPDNIKLGADIDTGSLNSGMGIIKSLEVKGKKQLDLNGHTLRMYSAKTAMGDMITIRHGDLTVLDGSSDQKGTILGSTYNDSCYLINVHTYGQFTLNSGTLKVDAGSLMNNTRWKRVIYCYAGGTVTINGGTLHVAPETYENEKHSYGMYFEEEYGDLRNGSCGYTLMAANSCKVSINGGTFQGPVRLDAGGSDWKKNEPRVTITGGTFEKKVMLNGPGDGTKPLTVISGGKFLDYVQAWAAASFDEKNPFTAAEVTVNGGEFHDTFWIRPTFPSSDIVSGGARRGYHLSARLMSATIYKRITADPDIIDLYKVYVDGKRDNSQKTVNDIYNLASEVLGMSVVQNNNGCFSPLDTASYRQMFSYRNTGKPETEGYLFELKALGDTPTKIIPNVWGMKSVTLDGNKINYAKDWTGEWKRIKNNQDHTLVFEWYPLSNDMINSGYTYDAKYLLHRTNSTDEPTPIPVDTSKNTVELKINKGALPGGYSYDFRLDLQKNGVDLSSSTNQHIVMLVVDPAQEIDTRTPIDSVALNVPKLKEGDKSGGNFTLSGTNTGVSTINTVWENIPASGTVAGNFYVARITLTAENGYAFNTKTQVNLNGDYSSQRSGIDNGGAGMTVLVSVPVRHEHDYGKWQIASTGDVHFRNCSCGVQESKPHEWEYLEGKDKYRCTVCGYEIDGEKERIGYVYASPRSPIDGESPGDYTPAEWVKIGGANYKVDSIVWKDENDNAVDTFESGKIYKGTVTFKADTGFAFDGDRIHANKIFDSSNAEVVGNYTLTGEGSTLTATFKLKNENVVRPGLNVKVKLPTLSDKIDQSLPEVELVDTTLPENVALVYSVVEGNIFTGTEITDPNYKVKPNQTYSYLAKLKLEGDSDITEAFNVSYMVTDGGDAETYIDTLSEVGVLAVYKTPDAAATSKINSVALTITAPKYGEAPADSATGADDTLYTVGEPTWSPKVTDGKFGAAAYTVSIPVTAAEGYSFDEHCFYTINGYVATYADGKVSYTFPALTVPHEHDYTGQPWQYLDPGNDYQTCKDGDGGLNIQAHTFGTWERVDGDTHKATCSKCNHEKTENHSWNFVKEDAPTLNAAGTRYYECSANGCKATKTESIPKLNAISAVNVTVSAPIKDAVPGTATTMDSAYNVAATDWEPSVSTFAGGTKYTVKVSLEANGNNRFTDKTTFQINGQTVKPVDTIPATGVVDNTIITLTFPATEGGSTSGGSSGGGGGGGVTKYAVAVSPADNGKVTPDKTSAAKGSVVTITAMANDGYALDTIKATDKAGKEIKLTDKGDGKYTFTMPASKVEVKAAFKQTASKPGKPAEEMKTVVVMQVGSKTMFVNGKAYEKDAAPVIMNDRTLVPIRFVTESLGGTVAWNAETKEVTLVIDGKEIKMTIGKTIEKYGVAPVIIDSRTFVPVRFVADELGATTAWNAETKTVTITKAVTPMKTEK